MARATRTPRAVKAIDSPMKPYLRNQHLKSKANRTTGANVDGAPHNKSTLGHYHNAGGAHASDHASVIKTT